MAGTRRARVALVAFAVLTALAPRRAAADCPPSVSFFPPGAEDFNVPVAWGRTQQRKAGNPYNDQLFTVLLSSNDNLPGSFAAGVPTLQVLPTHPLLTLGASGINASCRGHLERNGPPRSLLQRAAPQVTTVPRVAVSYILNPVNVPPVPEPDNIDRFVARYGAENATVNPDMAEAEVTRQVAKLQELAVSTNASVADAARKALQAYSAQQRARAEEERAAAAEILAQEAALSGAANGGARKVFPLRQSVPVGEFAYLNPVPRIKLEGLDTIPDGYYCLQVIVTILRGTGYMGENKVPARDMSTSREVCFYKLDTPPLARVKFNTCGPKFSMQLTDIQPVPVEVFPGTRKMLFTPVYHIRGILNKTAQWWVPIPEGHKQRFDYWAVVGKVPSNTTVYDFVPEDTLADGWWTIEVDGGLLSEFPSLLATESVERFGKKEDALDEMGVWRDMPAALQGLPKYAGGKMNLTRLLGLQQKVTAFNSFNGPDGVPLNEDFTFSWDIEGFGHQYCYIDGERRQNDGDFMCKSPINAQVNDDHTNHTLLVLMQDVCGTRVKVLARYGLWGYSLEEATGRTDHLGADEAAVDGGDAPLVNGSAHSHREGAKRAAARSAAGAARGGGAAAAAAAAGLAAAVAAALLLW